MHTIIFTYSYASIKFKISLPIFLNYFWTQWWYFYNLYYVYCDKYCVHF